MSNCLLSLRKNLEAEGKSALAVKSYLSDMKHFSRWFEETTGESFRPESVTALDVHTYKAHLLKEKGYKPATVNRKLSSLSMFCRWARREGLMQGDPTDEVSGVEEVKDAPRALAHLELLRLLRTVHRARHARDIAIVEVLANAGLRVGELTALTLDNVELSERKGWVNVRSGKGEKYRRVPLNADARKALAEYLEVRADGEDGQLFLRQRGGGLTSSGVWRVVKRYEKRAGLDISPHDLRHTYGTRLVREEGVDLVTVALLTGHKSLDTTAICTQPSEEDMARAAEKLSVR